MPTSSQAKPSQMPKLTCLSTTLTEKAKSRSPIVTEKLKARPSIMTETHEPSPATPDRGLCTNDLDNCATDLVAGQVTDAPDLRSMPQPGASESSISVPANLRSVPQPGASESSISTPTNRSNYASGQS
ncbi:hypothetical protein Lal_00032429 [Lupinus albus]|nr:hypothetical protein Lal_00032429 [Lupinus albus]